MPMLRSMARWLLPCLGILVWASTTGSLLADESAFSVLHLRDKSSLKGIFLGRSANEAYFAVRREWMKLQGAGVDRLAVRAAAEEKRAYEQLRDRLTDLLAEPDHPPHRFVLEQEQDRALAWLAAELPPTSELVLLSIPLADAVRMEPADPAKAPLAWWAWSKQIDAPESLTAAALQAKLVAMGVDGRGELPDLGARFQAVPQQDDEWHARLALVRYSRSQAIDFQGTAGMMIRIQDSKEPADLSQLLAQAMKHQTQQVLSDLLNEPKSKETDWLQDCIRKLASEKEDYFRATRVAMDPVGGTARVESVFMVKMPGGDWVEIWRQNVDADTRQVSETTVHQLEADPQIQSLRSLLTTLGLGSDELLRDAMGMGGATMQAQQQVNSRFEFFRQRFQHRLDVPILRWDVANR